MDQNPRTWDDEMLDLALRLGLPGLDASVMAEAARRAEIRINRVAAGMITMDAAREKHDAPWYDSRQSEAEWLAEMGL